MLRVMLREMLRQVLRLILRWLLRSMPTDVLREMPTLVPTVVLRMLPRMVRTVLLRQVPTTFANRGAKRMLTTVPTVLLTLLRTVHSQTTTKDTTANNPRRAVAIRSGRATNGDEANAVETLVCTQTPPPNEIVRKKRGSKPSDKKRQKAAMNLSQFVALTCSLMSSFAASKSICHIRVLSR